jgi:hypothetical protein
MRAATVAVTATSISAHPTTQRFHATSTAISTAVSAAVLPRRFGSYKYEVANQDHSLMLGVECVDNILFGSQELTLEFPNIVNPRKNMELKVGPGGGVEWQAEFVLQWGQWRVLLVGWEWDLRRVRQPKTWSLRWGRRAGW